MTYETITVEEENGITTITLNRPDKLNALNKQMRDDLLAVFADLANEKATRVVVVTGAGRAFCAGADIGVWRDRMEGRKRGERELEDRVIQGFTQRLFALIRSIEKPIIASVNGPAMGFGCGLALACDIRIASEDARLGLVFTRMGIIPDFTYFLIRLVGIAKACELVFTAKTVTAQEGKEIGLVNQVVPASDIKKATYEMAANIAKLPPLAIQLSKRVLYQGLTCNDPNAQLNFEVFVNDWCFRTEDNEEAVNAFLEKREPVFKGR